jgi:hypothetical protein
MPFLSGEEAVPVIQKTPGSVRESDANQLRVLNNFHKSRMQTIHQERFFHEQLGTDQE